MLELPQTDLDQGPRRQDARRRADVELLALQEGTLGVDPEYAEDQ